MASAPSSDHRRPVLAGLIALGAYLSYLTLSPFVAAFTWAVIFAILFRDAQVAMAGRIGPSWAAIALTVLVATVIVAPGAVLVSALAREAPQVTNFVRENSENAPGKIQRIWSTVRARSPFPMPEDPTDVLTAAAGRARGFATAHAGAFVTGSLTSLGTVAATLLALFFMLRDGDAMRRHFVDLLPFPREQSERLISDTSDLVIASVRAGIIVAVAQGVVGGLALWLLGLGPPAIWGVAIGLASLLPTGSATVWVPVAVWLMASGDILRGVIVLLVGVFGLSGLGNVLRPMLLSGKSSMNGAVVFFGLFGGAAAFGLVGLVVGPIILVTTARLIRTVLHSDVNRESPAEGQNAAA